MENGKREEVERERAGNWGEGKLSFLLQLTHSVGTAAAKKKASTMHSIVRAAASQARATGVAAAAAVAAACAKLCACLWV